jgi:hypothetical protein
VSTWQVVNALYSQFLERGVRYFFRDCSLELIGQIETGKPTLTFHPKSDGSIELGWFTSRYVLRHKDRSFTEHEMRLIGAVGNVFSARYRSVFKVSSLATTLNLFRGLPEDRFISAFLDSSPYLDGEGLPGGADRIADAIEVLRVSSLITYEGRRISTGVLLLGSRPDPNHTEVPLPRGAHAYTIELTSIKSFHRLCDGLQTVFLVDQDGLLVDLVDVQHWPGRSGGVTLPAPSSQKYRAHCLGTLYGGHICLVLTANGEIKVFAEGTQVFNFLGGQWRLTDAAEKYYVWKRAIGHHPLAERLMTVALNLAEARHGALFVVLDKPDSARKLVLPGDMLDENQVQPAERSEAGPKERIHYLLRRKRILDLAPSVLETIAGMDGSIVLDRESNLLAFGAILRHDLSAFSGSQLVEGGRTTAAVAASRFGNVLKTSEDGLVAFYQNGQKVWEM